MSGSALIYGSDTGVTEEIVSVILDLLNDKEIPSVNVFNIDINYFNDYDRFILGLSTWYDGELQSDWDEFFDGFKKIDFNNKKIAIFGLGDQEGYADYFVDGIGIIAEVIVNNGGKIFGKWPTDNYNYNKSKALTDNNLFYGLAIDEDNQPELTDNRIEKWLHQIEKEGFWN